MATLDKLSTLKVLLSDDSVVLPDDDALNVYLNIAEQKILNRLYPFTTDYSELTVPDKYAFLQCQVAEYIINKRGAEGELSHNENGINRTYESADIPKSLLSQITPYVGVISGTFDINKHTVGDSDENTGTEQG